MNRQVLWSPASERDFETILDYLQSNWSGRVIAKFINKVDNQIGLILEKPEIFPMINDKLKIRKSVVTKHNTLYYREINNNIEIVRLFDSRQDPKKLTF